MEQASSSHPAFNQVLHHESLKHRVAFKGHLHLGGILYQHCHLRIDDGDVFAEHQVLFRGNIVRYFDRFKWHLHGHHGRKHLFGREYQPGVRARMALSTEEVFLV